MHIRKIFNYLLENQLNHEFIIASHEVSVHIHRQIGPVSIYVLLEKKPSI